jgi:hypothetical protein
MNRYLRRSFSCGGHDLKLRGERKRLNIKEFRPLFSLCGAIRIPAQTKDVVVVRVGERFLQSKRKTITSHSQTTSLSAQEISEIKVKRSRKRFHLIQFVLFAPEVIVGRAATNLTNQCDISKSDSISSQPVKSQTILFAARNIAFLLRSEKFGDRRLKIVQKNIFLKCVTHRGGGVQKSREFA